MNYCKRKNEPTDTVHCLNCEHCLPPGERTGGRMCPDEITDLEVIDIINKGLDNDAKNILDFEMQCLDANCAAIRTASTDMPGYWTGTSGTLRTHVVRMRF